MMPQERQVPEKPPDPGELVERARASLADLERSKAALLERSARGDGNARVLLAAMVVLRDFAAKTEAAMVAAAIDAAREIRYLTQENARLRAELEETRRPGRRPRHAAGRPLWPRAVRSAVPVAALPAGLRHAGSLLGHHAAAKAVIGTSAIAASAVLVIGTGVTRTVPYQTPAPAGPSAARAPAAQPYAAVRIPRDAASAAPRARTAAQSASPAPSASPPPSSAPAAPPPSPPPPAPAPVPAIAVPRILDLGAMTRGPLTLTAGPQAVTWTLSATDGIQVLENGAPVTGGVMTAGQELDLTVIAPAGKGWVYVSFGGTTVPVEVSSDWGSPAS